MAKPLLDLTRKDMPFEWGIEARIAFKNLKKKFTTQLVLAIFDLELEIVLETDALDFALRAYLSQKAADSKLHLVAYYLRTLTLTERNYNVYNKELLAIVAVCKV